MIPLITREILVAEGRIELENKLKQVDPASPRGLQKNLEVQQVADTDRKTRSTPPFLHFERFHNGPSGLESEQI